MNENILSPQNHKRNVGIDIIKAIAIIGVIIIHTSTDTLVGDVKAADFAFGLLWRCLTGASVPLFLMCSGALLLNPRKETSVKKLWTKNILRIFVAMLFWAMFYKLLYLFYYSEITLHNVWLSLLNVLAFNQEFHLYYIHITLLVYAFLPVTKIFINNASKRDIEYFLVIWLILGIVYPTVCIYKPFIYLSGYSLQWMMNACYSAIGFGVLGHYLNNYGVSVKLSVTSLAVGFAGVFGITLFMSRKTGALYQHFLSGSNFFITVFAIGIFSLCLKLSKTLTSTSFLYKAFLFLSKASFCIYLCHVVYIRVFTYFGFTVNILPAVISVPLITVCNLAGSVAIYLVLSRIPFINKWLI